MKPLESNDTGIKTGINHIDNCRLLPMDLFLADFTKDNTFWSDSYFKMIGDTCDDDFEQHWLVNYNESGEITAAATFQVFHFEGKNYRYEFNAESASTLVPEISKWIFKYLIRPFSIKILLQGNAFTTGNFSIVCDRNKISQKEWIEKINDWQWNDFLPKRNDIRGVLWKDFCDEEVSEFQQLEDKGFFRFNAQPTMVFPIPNEWNQFNDYLGAMQSKYRIRMKKVFKKGGDVELKWLSHIDIKEKISEIESLYNQVVAPSNFKMTTLPVDHLWKLKEQENTGFEVLGFYAPEGLIGFISFYKINNEMHAGFMGIERKYQLKYDQYLRTLLELVKNGIELGYSHLYFGRTAHEIKSSTGAMPQSLYLYGKHRNTILNKILDPVVNKLSSQAEWIQRHPFK